MAVMFANLYQALKAAGAPDDVAMSAAQEMASSLATTDAVGDLRSDISELRKDVATAKTDIGVLKTDVAVLKWMAGFNLAFVIVILGILLRQMH